MSVKAYLTGGKGSRLGKRYFFVLKQLGIHRPTSFLGPDACLLADTNEWQQVESIRYYLVKRQPNNHEKLFENRKKMCNYIKWIENF